MATVPMPPKMRPAATITRGSREDSAVPGFRELDRRDVDRIREVLAQPELHQVAA